MKNIILFASRHGNTERILTELVNRASASASGELLLKPVRKTPRKDLEDADRIAVGGPVYMGKMRGEVAAFLSRNRALLLSKPLALFAGCLARGDEARAQLERVFPADLREEHCENGGSQTLTRGRGAGDPVPLPGRRILNRAAGRKGRGHIMVDVPGGAISPGGTLPQNMYLTPAAKPIPPGLSHPNRSVSSPAWTVA